MLLHLLLVSFARISFRQTGEWDKFDKDTLRVLVRGIVDEKFGESSNMIAPYCLDSKELVVFVEVTQRDRKTIWFCTIHSFDLDIPDTAAYF
jgi:hypothetical protein